MHVGVVDRDSCGAVHIEDLGFIGTTNHIDPTIELVLGKLTILVGLHHESRVANQGDTGVDSAHQAQRSTKR